MWFALPIAETTGQFAAVHNAQHGFDLCVRACQCATARHWRFPSESTHPHTYAVCSSCDVKVQSNPCADACPQTCARTRAHVHALARTHIQHTHVRTRAYAFALAHACLRQLESAGSSTPLFTHNHSSTHPLILVPSLPPTHSATRTRAHTHTRARARTHTHPSPIHTRHRGVRPCGREDAHRDSTARVRGACAGPRCPVCRALTD